ncbi:hypothetical protein HH310_12460 [Actinoplanes sp. TBRC 11911]|uniref:hypothetical protein n=1 Tax=Actinoplanes sp. TBRC 11911 TaxID=2729386 RepID=UPI00145E1F1F|nr:hypothetical protein [Actinoplanes sp. TBRC 11911]NMO52006.1 hypothetical protein [Actinoplanes sp. TBRC 11911]
MAGQSGGLLLSWAVLFASADWIGWWSRGLVVAAVVAGVGLVLMAWAHGYVACAERRRRGP